MGVVREQGVFEAGVQEVHMVPHDLVDGAHSAQALPHAVPPRLHHLHRHVVHQSLRPVRPLPVSQGAPRRPTAARCAPHLHKVEHTVPQRVRAPKAPADVQLSGGLLCDPRVRQPPLGVLAQENVPKQHLCQALCQDRGRTGGRGGAGCVPGT